MALAVEPPPLSQDLLKDDGAPSDAWATGYFQPINLALNALFAAAALPDKLPPPQLGAQILYESLSNVGQDPQRPPQFNPLAMRTVWIGWFTAVYDAVLKLDAVAALTVTVTAVPLGASVVASLATQSETSEI